MPHYYPSESVPRYSTRNQPTSPPCLASPALTSRAMDTKKRKRLSLPVPCEEGAKLTSRRCPDPAPSDAGNPGQQPFQTEAPKGRFGGDSSRLDAGTKVTAPRLTLYPPTTRSNRGIPTSATTSLVPRLSHPENASTANSSGSPVPGLQPKARRLPISLSRGALDRLP